MFSRRSSRDRQPNRIARALAELPAPRFDLTRTNPTRSGVAYPSEALAEALASGSRAGYAPEAFGCLAAREAVAARVLAARGVATDDILLTSSTSEAYSYLFKLLCDPGDSVLVPAPSYPLFEQLAELECVELRTYRVDYDGGWYVDLDSLLRARTTRTRAVVLVSPNNPTGQYVKRAELARVAELGLPLISDEVFAEYELGLVADRALTALEASECLVFALGGLSKWAGLPGCKLAWTLLGGPTALRREARERLELIADGFLSPNAPVQASLGRLLELGEGVQGAIRARCRGNLATLELALHDTALDSFTPEGGWSAVVRVPRLANEDEIVLELLREESVLVQPGWFYDFEREPLLVLGLLTEPSLFAEGVRRLVQRIKLLGG